MLRTMTVLILLACCAPALAQDAPDAAKLEAIKAQEAEAAARKAKLEKERKAANAEIKKLRENLIAAAAQAQTYEKAAQSAARALSDLNEKSSDLRKALTADQRAMTGLLAILQRLERNPPPAVAVQPVDAVKAARAAGLMASINRQLELRAAAISGKLAELEILQSEIGVKQSALSSSEKDLQRRRKEIASQVDEKKELEAGIREQSAQQDKIIARLTSQAKDLEGLIAAFEARARKTPRVKPGDSGGLRGQSGDIPWPRKKPRADRAPEPFVMPPQTDRFADARGALRAPVSGRITGKYNTRLKDGSRSQGLTVTGASKAQVVAPYTGRIAFVGPFKNYDSVYMLDVGQGYFIVLTGLGKTYGREGDTVALGEPIGEMPAKPGAALYIELWKNGSPSDPTPWFGPAFTRSG